MLQPFDQALWNGKTCLDERRTGCLEILFYEFFDLALDLNQKQEGFLLVNLVNSIYLKAITYVIRGILIIKGVLLKIVKNKFGKFK